MMKNRPVCKFISLAKSVRCLLSISICVFQGITSLSQEVLSDMGINPLIKNNYQKLTAENYKLKTFALDTLSLPFLDDFSKENIYPDALLWLDSSVFINRDYPIAPPTLGAATFDGVSISGNPYDTTLTNPNASLPADTLTSKPINLSLLPTDSTVILSFFYQVKGRGNDPEPSDTLLLDFLNPATQAWKTVWFKKGYNPSSSDTVFHLAIVPIADTAYLKNAFQFRFRNKATVSGNVDHWHIDYVLLDKNRNMGDTIFSDVAFAYNSHSLLKNYYAMPWNQYQASEMRTSLNFFIRNNDTIEKNTSFDYTIYNNTGGTETTYSGGSDNCDPYSTNGYWNYSPISNPPLTYSYPLLTDTGSFSAEFVLGTTVNDKNKWNDTLRFKQKFHNYFAYDDGTVEAGYGLSGQNAFGGQIAYKFNLNSPDTLLALQMLFNWIPQKSNQWQFRIRVWNDAGGVPGSLLYEDDYVTPNYQYVDHGNWGNLTNMFYPYPLTSKQALPAGTFYVGLVQYCCLQSGQLLNIGYDKNTKSNNKIFFNTGSGWNQSALADKGSLMIRPVFGDTAGLLGIKEQSDHSYFTISPNPSNGQFYIQSPTSNIKTLEIFNLIGKKIFESANQAPHSYNIDISHMPDGIYLLRLLDDQGAIFSKKLILAK